MKPLDDKIKMLIHDNLYFHNLSIRINKKMVGDLLNIATETNIRSYLPSDFRNPYFIRDDTINGMHRVLKLIEIDLY